METRHSSRLEVTAFEPASLLNETLALRSRLREVNALLIERDAQIEALTGALRDESEEREFLRAELQIADARLQAMSTTDALTGLKNHRAFRDRLDEEILRVSRYQSSLSLVLLDVDQFREFNETYGHPAGDMVLKGIAHLLQETVRETDLLARYGGEEFAILLPGIGRSGVCALAERFRERVADAPFPERQITVSLGVASVSLYTKDSAQLLEQAEAALFTSKRNGRNCLTLYSEPSAPCIE